MPKKIAKTAGLGKGRRGPSSNPTAGPRDRNSSRLRSFSTKLLARAYGLCHFRTASLTSVLDKLGSSAVPAPVSPPVSVPAPVPASPQVPAPAPVPASNSASASASPPGPIPTSSLHRAGPSPLVVLRNPSSTLELERKPKFRRWTYPPTSTIAASQTTSLEVKIRIEVSTTPPPSPSPLKREAEPATLFGSRASRAAEPKVTERADGEEEGGGGGGGAATAPCRRAARLAMKREAAAAVATTTRTAAPIASVASAQGVKERAGERLTTGGEPRRSARLATKRAKDTRWA
ncbi:hypothetical protein A4X13_0g330 [Tilletia indica]|uniref:Uncharacterized protein n=1 Tax=Tilletia indica TaxID=43049 RepID=A0A177TRW1_9BASI|nr:hypothetical protein A4X13_0g330 [Tilletia indica]